MTDTASLPLPRPLPADRHIVADDSVRRVARLGHAGRRRNGRRVPAGFVMGIAVLVATLIAVAGWAGHLFSGTGVTFGSAGSSPTGPLHAPVLDPTATGKAGGVVPGGTSAFDVDVPAVAGLDPLLLDALQRATAGALADGVPVVVNSGWRSPAYQEKLLGDAIAEYGTPDEAARWVATPATSAHVHGDAVDVGSWDATDWLSPHGADYDLCQIYMNETWHYELRAGASTGGCQPMFRDPTEDPRLQQR